MSDCSCGGQSSGGPFSEGKELVEFVFNAHGGTVKDRLIPNGGLQTKCRGCNEEFILKTFVDICPNCKGVHAVSPPRANDEANIQFAGADFKLPE